MLNHRTFNVRIVVDGDTLRLGNVQGFYRKGNRLILRAVPPGVREQLARRLQVVTLKGSK